MANFKALIDFWITPVRLVREGEVFPDTELSHLTDDEILYLQNMTIPCIAATTDAIFVPPVPEPPTPVTFPATSGADITGQYLGASPDDTYAGLPTTDANGDAASSGDFAILSQDDIGTGTVNAPQYPAGRYITDGTTFTFDSPIGGSGGVSSDADNALTLGTDQLPYYADGENITIAQSPNGAEIPAAPDFTDLVHLPTNNTPNTLIETGVDLNNVDKIVLSYARNTGTVANPSLAQAVTATIDLRTFFFDIDQGGLGHWWDNTGLRIRINTADKANGRIFMSSLTSLFSLQRIEFKKRSTEVNKVIDVFTGSKAATASFADFGDPNIELEAVKDTDLIVLQFGDGTTANGVFLDGVANASREGGIGLHAQILAGGQLQVRHFANGGGTITRIRIITSTPLDLPTSDAPFLRAADDGRAVTPGEYFVNSEGGAFGVTLTHSPEKVYRFEDILRRAGTNPVTIGAVTDTFLLGDLIVPGPLSLDVDGLALLLVANTTANEYAVRNDTEAPVSGYSLINGVHVYDYGDGFVRQWGRDDPAVTGSSGNNTIDLAVEMADLTYDAHVTVYEGVHRSVHLDDSSTTTSITLNRSNTAAKVNWSVFGRKA